MNIEKVVQLRNALSERIRGVVVDQQETVDLMLTALLSEGHILLEGVPGTAKTLIARAFAACLSLEFKRIQFTPDLMPGDVLGTNLFNFQTGEFTFVKGPVFTEMLLADEINRTPPKTQSALLEAMQEKNVTVDGETRPLSAGFIVIATQNPIEQEGTYPLPEAQLDRFLFKLQVAYPGRDREVDMVKIHGHRRTVVNLKELGIHPLCDLQMLTEIRKAVLAVRMEDDVINYIVDLVRATRDDASLHVGASPRATILMALASRATAALSGRDYVIPDDVKSIFIPAMRHRVVLSAGADLEGRNSDEVLTTIIQKVPAPR
jgi:MoxR-like ATPase